MGISASLPSFGGKDSKEDYENERGVSNENCRVNDANEIDDDAAAWSEAANNTECGNSKQCEYDHPPCDRVVEEQQRPAPLSPINQNTATTIATITSKTTKLVVACPRFLDQQRRFCMEKKDLEKFFVDCIRTQRQSNSTVRTKQDWAGFSFRIELGATESSHIRVHLFGAPNLIRELVEALQSWYGEQSRQTNGQQIREWGVTVTVELDPTQNIGASLHHAKTTTTTTTTTTDHCRAAEISVDVKAHGQLQTALGDWYVSCPDYVPFAIVDRVQGVQCTSIQQFKEVVQIAKKNGTKLQLQLKIAPPDQVDRLCRIPLLQPVTILEAGTETVDRSPRPKANNLPEPSRRNNLGEQHATTSEIRATQQSSPADNRGLVHTDIDDDTNVESSGTPLVLGTIHAIANTLVEHRPPDELDQSNVGSPPETESVPKECIRILPSSPSVQKRDNFVSEPRIAVDPPNQDQSPMSDFTGDPAVPPQEQVRRDNHSPSHKAISLLDHEKPRPALGSNTKRKMTLSAGATRGRKKVRFSFESGAAAEPFQSTSDHTVTTNPEPSGAVDVQTNESILPSLILDRPCSDLLTFLTTGDVHNTCTAGQLDESRLLIKTTLQELDATKNEDCERAILDLSIKDRALKIVSLAIKAGEEAQSVGEWERIQIKIRKIDDIVLAHSIATTPETKIKAEISAVYGNGPEVLRRLPWVPFKEGSAVLYDTGTCQLNYNPVSQTDRRVVVNLYTTDDKVGNKRTGSLLGEIVVRLSDLHNELVVPDGSTVSTFTAAPGNKMLYAKVHLAARRIRAPDDYIERKLKIARTTLHKVVECILALNSDVTVWNNRFPDRVIPPCAFANIRLGDNDSLVHAAIHVTDLELVQRVLSLGTGTFAESTAVAAMALAQKRMAASKDRDELEKIVGVLSEYISHCPVKKLVHPLGSAENENGSPLATTDEDVGPLSTCDMHDTLFVASPNPQTGDQGERATKATKVAMDPVSKRENIIGMSSASQSWTERRKCAIAAKPGTKAANDSIFSKWAAGFSGPNNRPVSAPKTTSEELPMLSSSDWLVPTNLQKYLCTHWEKGQGTCKFGSACHFIHRQRPWGKQKLEALWLQMGTHRPTFCLSTIARYLVTLWRVDARGREWWTAGYQNLHADRMGGQEIFYAEGMRSTINSQGVSWYATRAEACIALERVIIVSRFVAQCHSKPKPNDIREPRYQHAADVPGYNRPATKTPGAAGVQLPSARRSISLPGAAAAVKPSEDVPGYYGPATKTPGAAGVQLPSAIRSISLPGAAAAVKPSTGILMPSKYSAAAQKPSTVTTRLPTLPKCTRKHGLPATKDVGQQTQKRIKGTLPSTLSCAEERNAL